MVKDLKVCPSYYHLASVLSLCFRRRMWPMEGVEGHHGAEHGDDGEVGDGGPGHPALASLRRRLHLSFPGATSEDKLSPDNIVQRRN